jgi:hypothetical protein
MACSELVRKNAADHEQADPVAEIGCSLSTPHDGERDVKMLGNTSLPTRCTRTPKTPYRFMYITVSIRHTDSGWWKMRSSGGPTASSHTRSEMTTDKVVHRLVRHCRVLEHRLQSLDGRISARWHNDIGADDERLGRYHGSHCIMPMRCMQMRTCKR